MRHMLLIPASEDEVHEWDYARDKRFISEEKAVACPTQVMRRKYACAQRVDER